MIAGDTAGDTAGGRGNSPYIEWNNNVITLITPIITLFATKYWLSLRKYAVKFTRFLNNLTANLTIF